MKNKTWFDLWPILLIAFIAPLVIILIPTIELKGQLIGGGPIRDYYINLFLPHLYYEHADAIYYLIQNDAYHFGFAIIVGLNIGLVLTWIAFAFSEAYMAFANFYSNKSLDLKRKSIRR